MLGRILENEEHGRAEHRFRHGLNFKRTSIPAVGENKDALSAVEELADHLHAEAVPEPVPHVRPQAVAEHEPDGVLAVARARRRREQIPRRLAHIHKRRGARGADVVPERARAEAFADARAHARRQTHDERRVGGAVVQRHADVEARAVGPGLTA